MRDVEGPAVRGGVADTVELHDLAGPPEADELGVGHRPVDEEHQVTGRGHRGE